MSGKSVDVDYHTNDEAKETDIKYLLFHSDIPSRKECICTRGIPMMKWSILCLLDKESTPLYSNLPKYVD